MGKPEIEKAYNTVEEYFSFNKGGSSIRATSKGEEHERLLIKVDDVVVEGDMVYIQTKPYSAPSFNDPDRMVIKRVYEFSKEDLIKIIWEYHQLPSETIEKIIAQKQG